MSETRTNQLNLGQQKILITGASGFIGTHLARRLAFTGSRVYCLDILPPREILRGVKYIIADVRNLALTKSEAFDCIFNLAAVHTTPGHEDAEYYDTNVLGAIEVVNIAERMQIPRVVFTSSISVYGPSEDEQTEESVTTPISAYGKSKLMAEKIHSQWQNVSSSRFLSIVRPAVVFGPGEGGNFARMAKLLSRGVFIFPGRRDTIKSCIYIDDLIDLLIHAAQSEEQYNVINACYDQPATIEEIVVTLKQLSFPSAVLLDVPARLVIALSVILSRLNALGLGVHPDRVLKLIRSTNIYPGWACARGLMNGRSVKAGIEKWALATHQRFV